TTTTNPNVQPGLGLPRRVQLGQRRSLPSNNLRRANRVLAPPSRNQTVPLERRRGSAERLFPGQQGLTRRRNADEPTSVQQGPTGRRRGGRRRRADPTSHGPLFFLALQAVTHPRAKKPGSCKELQRNGDQT